MFTVVISSKKVREDCQKKYSRFLEPLFDSEKFAFCDWDIRGDSPESAVPGLKYLAAEHKEWRAVIVEDCFETDEGKILSDELRKQRNPFEYVKCYDSVDDIRTPEDAAAFREKKYAAYEKAAENPLFRLGTWLCDGCIKTDPEVSEEILSVSENCDEAYGEWLKKTGNDIADIEYELSRKKKYDLIREIWNPDEINFIKPQEVLCIAPRTFDDDKLLARLAWAKTNEFEYSSFYETNLYPDKLRYLVFDIPNHNHQNYEAEYVNFLSFLLIFAGNEYPRDALRPNRVYNVNCANDDEALSDFLSIYDYKLSLTESYISGKINELNHHAPQLLTNDELEDLYLYDSEVQVQLDDDFDMDLLHAESKGIGLSEDCPVDEMGFWNSQYCRIIKNFKLFMKQPRRALKRSAEYVRDNDTANLEKASAINEFQEEDIEEKLYEDERKMIESRIESVCNTKAYFKAFSENDKKVRRVIRTRMTKKTTVLLSIAVLLVYFVGFIPLFASNLEEDGALGIAAKMTLCAVGALALIGFICLFYLRSKLVTEIRSFNLRMTNVIESVMAGMNNAAEYLGKVCDVLRINSVLNYLHRDHDDTSIQCSVYKNHIAQIEKERRECGYIFNKFITKKEVPDCVDIEPYNFDFSRDCEYEYKIPENIWDSRTIEFMQSDNLIEVPVNFVKSIRVEREELFDV